MARNPDLAGKPPERQIEAIWLAAIELPFALISTFEPRPRDWLAIIVAGSKGYDLLGSQRVDRQGRWVASFQTFSLGDAFAGGSPRAHFSAAFEGEPLRPAILRARLPLVGGIEAVLETKEP